MRDLTAQELPRADLPMTIRLATPPASRALLLLGKTRLRMATVRAANDNGVAGSTDRMLHAALRQFARHGVGAAEHARRQAERAFFKGDSETYRWWLGICRTLDRRMAARLEAVPGRKNPANPR